MTDPSRPATGYPAPQTGAIHPPNGYPPPGTTGYRYAAPLPQSNYQYYNTNPYYDISQRATFYRRLLAVIIALFIIFGVALFITWLVLRPRLPEFRVDSLSVSQFKLSSSPSQISGKWDVLFTVSNPNTKMHVYYDAIDAFLYYKSELLAQNQLVPFDQGTKSQTNVSTELVAASAYVDGKVVSAINSDRSHGSVNFNVKLLAIVRFKAGAWRARKRWLKVYCDNLTVGVSSNDAKGTLTGGSRKCDVGLFVIVFWSENDKDF
ncbi:hypothetical protein Nepgr_012979 [Nepenthes gracilis]|uniref:Late embryogenesis abundant protein LEA-2 subgroup domain-containing protein n=1 Tax=Nepenthes gracilis TaxID=150966 RepID=A0AAD3SGY1_NEPGR|nr:hypothetical protein Nepgr_012979 [Nepenthes gracilis]